MTDLNIRIESHDRFFDRVRKLARQFDETGVLPSDHGISFSTLDQFLEVMSPNRWKLLQKLRSMGSTSIRALSIALQRDYKAVHTDVIALVNAGLIARDEKQRISVPWTRLITETNLDAAA